MSGYATWSVWQDWCRCLRQDLVSWSGCGTYRDLEFLLTQVFLIVFGYVVGKACIDWVNEASSWAFRWRQDLLSLRMATRDRTLCVINTVSASLFVTLRVILIYVLTIFFVLAALVWSQKPGFQYSCLSCIFLHPSRLSYSRQKSKASRRSQQYFKQTTAKILSPSEDASTPSIPR